MNKQLKSRKVLGMMSGTSLDGLDICLSEFYQLNGNWKYEIIKAETIAYSNEWNTTLGSLFLEKGQELIAQHHRYGHYLGKQAKLFLEKYNLHAELIASHGHTIFHQPDLAYGFQLGSGAAIAASSSLPVVCDFRSTDIALGGQGAPLVPLGDEYLFSDYSACVNLGGFANLSFNNGQNRIGFDICPVNIALNRIAKIVGKSYDKNGEMASSGKVIPKLLQQLNEIDFYHSTGPKSLGLEWLENEFLIFIESALNPNPEDLLATLVEHAATQISTSLKAINCSKRVLFTGGGVKNTYLIEKIKSKGIDAVIPNLELIDFKEALVFAFLGHLRWEKKINVFSSVTGARKDSVSGTLYFV